jgi:nicotinamide-nucleotide amidase
MEYRIALLNIGTELLKGRTVNTNAAWLGRRLFAAGLSLNEVAVVHDEGDAIAQSLLRLMDGHDAVIVTGGLGPTKDDITKHRLKDIFGGEWVTHQPTLERLEEWSRLRNRTMNEAMRQQASLPSSCTPLVNRIGSAPGMAFRQGPKWVFAMPGVPSEMQILIEEQVLPLIAEHATPWITAQVRLFGKSEAEIALEMEAMEAGFPEGLRISWLPTSGEVKIELSLPAGEGSQAALDAVRVQLETHFAKWHVTSDELPLAAVLGRELRARGLGIACAESCTGGAIAAALTAISGSSDYFRASLVTYTEDAKQQLLGVPQPLIQAHTVVSAEVAAAMAVGARQRTGAEVAIATTGALVAVKDDPVYAKPVVHIAVATDAGVEQIQLALWQDRASNRLMVVNAALFLALKQVRG